MLWENTVRLRKLWLSGLWINEKFLHFAASPDGLIFNDGKLDGILEVKWLKILRLHSVTDLINKECPAGELNRQGFKVSGNNLILKKTTCTIITKFNSSF